jgi:sugar phosphate permease
MGESKLPETPFSKDLIAPKVSSLCGCSLLEMFFSTERSVNPYHSWTMKRSGHVRWWIVWTLFFSTVTNYISRQTFSVLSPMIAAQYHLSHTDLAKIVGAFQFSYAVTWLLGGIFLDAVGTRLGLALAVVF